MRTDASLLGLQEDGSKPDAWAYLYVVSPTAVLSLVPFALLLEGGPLVAQLPKYSVEQLLQLAFGLGFTSALATGLVLTQAIALRHTSAFSVAVLAFVKDTFQVVAGSLALSEPLNLSSAAGIGIVLLSSATYVVHRSWSSNESKQGVNISAVSSAAQAGAAPSCPAVSRTEAREGELDTLIPEGRESVEDGTCEA
jgi:hypothetical protein